MYRGEDCVKKFCKSLREHAMKIINFKKKKMKPLTSKQQESYKNAKICCKKYRKVRYPCPHTYEYRGAAAHSR